MNLAESLLKNDSIILNAEANSWQEAIKIGTDKLEEKNIISMAYYQAILNNTAKFGPYFLIAPRIAMPHASPKDGVNETGFALVTLKQGINFGDPDNDPIDIIIILATKGNEEHLQAIVQIISLFEDENNIDLLRQAETAEEVIAFINKITTTK